MRDSSITYLVAATLISSGVTIKIRPNASLNLSIPKTLWVMVVYQTHRLHE